MGWGRGLGAALWLLAGSAASSEPAPARLLAPVSAAAPDPRLFAEAILLASNDARARAGLPPLAYDPALGQAAAAHAANMARLRMHGHTLPVEQGARYRDRLVMWGVVYRRAGENIARGKAYQLLDRPIRAGAEGCAFFYSDTGAPVPIHSYASLAAETVDRWLASPRHRAALLSPQFGRLGAGIGGDPDAAGCGDLYMAQTFAD